MPFIVHVAVAVIKNQHGQIFIAKRPKDTHQGGLWEFPGGKIEKNENVLDALKRELFEEVGITFTKATPLIRIHHDYGDKSVLLDVWCIEDFSGTAYGKEGQETCWVEKSELSMFKFPAANRPIVKAVQLPDRYMITGDFYSEEDLIARIQIALDKGVKLIQFRAPDLGHDSYFHCAEKIYNLCNIRNAMLLLNTSFSHYIKYQAFNFSHGLHLNSKEVKLFSRNEVSESFLVSTSTHNEAELKLAEQKNVDFVLLSPVNKTQTHPDSMPLGWDNFKLLTDKVNIPVYALGGMSINDLSAAKNNGAQGIAAISEFWKI